MSYEVQCPQGHVYTAPEGTGLENLAKKQLEKRPERGIAWIGQDTCKVCQRELQEKEAREQKQSEVRRLFGKK